MRHRCAAGRAAHEAQDPVVGRAAAHRHLEWRTDFLLAQHFAFALVIGSLQSGERATVAVIARFKFDDAIGSRRARIDDRIVQNDPPGRGGGTVLPGDDPITVDFDAPTGLVGHGLPGGRERDRGEHQREQGGKPPRGT
ncbi:hypothetical protein SDC9_185496 [bioreactor metagenome]|uniref:Uncharacterized protein n=1 Tax=bioreactor metagenome TaxID=1076179 RepID=A0A645HG14_9ZZZZ